MGACWDGRAQGAEKGGARCLRGEGLGDGCRNGGAELGSGGTSAPRLLIRARVIHPPREAAKRVPSTRPVMTGSQRLQWRRAGSGVGLGALGALGHRVARNAIHDHSHRLWLALLVSCDDTTQRCHVEPLDAKIIRPPTVAVLRLLLLGDLRHRGRVTRPRKQNLPPPPPPPPAARNHQRRLWSTKSQTDTAHPALGTVLAVAGASPNHLEEVRTRVARQHLGGELRVVLRGTCGRVSCTARAAGDTCRRRRSRRVSYLGASKVHARVDVPTPPNSHPC
jgi:hypothetical protein